MHEKCKTLIFQILTFLNMPYEFISTYCLLSSLSCVLSTHIYWPLKLLTNTYPWECIYFSSLSITDFVTVLVLEYIIPWPCFPLDHIENQFQIPRILAFSILQYYPKVQVFVLFYFGLCFAFFFPQYFCQVL